MFDLPNPAHAYGNGVRKYNPVLPQLQALTDELTAIGKRYGLSCSQTAIACAMTKGVQPIIGATKPHHVTEAAQVGDTRLTPSEVAELERLAAATGIDTRGGWEGKA